MHTEHFIAGKDASLESSIATMQAKLAAIGFRVEERSWLNPVDGAWSVHLRDRDCPLPFTNGKGATKLDAGRRRVYRCIEALLGLDAAGGQARYAEALRALYGEDTLRLAQALLAGEQRFFGMAAPGATLAGCALHGQLLAAYAKVQAQQA